MVKRLFLTGALAVCVIRWALGSFACRTRRRRRLEGDESNQSLEDPQTSNANEPLPAAEGGNLSSQKNCDQEGEDVETTQKYPGNKVAAEHAPPEDMHSQDFRTDAPNHEEVANETEISPRDKVLAEAVSMATEYTAIQSLSGDANVHTEEAEESNINPRASTEDRNVDKEDKDHLDNHDQQSKEAEAKATLSSPANSATLIAPSLPIYCDREEERPQVDTIIKTTKETENQTEKELDSQYQRPRDRVWSKVGLRSDHYVPHYRTSAQGPQENSRWAKNAFCSGSSFLSTLGTRKNRRSLGHESKSGRCNAYSRFHQCPQWGNNQGTKDPWSFQWHGRGRTSKTNAIRGRGKKIYEDFDCRGAPKSALRNSSRDRFQS